MGVYSTGLVVHPWKSHGGSEDSRHRRSHALSAFTRIASRWETLARPVIDSPEPLWTAAPIVGQLHGLFT